MSFFTKRKQLFILVVVGIFFIIGYWMNSDYKNNIEFGFESEEFDSKEELDQKTEAEIYVHICGAVKNPGVYKVDNGSRLIDVVDKAGGFEYNADKESENLARTVEDEEKIIIAEIGKNIANTSESQVIEVSDGKISLNSASKTELETLPGIGEKKAELIIEYRQKHRFKTIDEVKLINGIGDKTYEKLKSKVRI